MSQREFTFNILIFLSIISFGIVGSLSHIFNLSIIILLSLHFLTLKEKLEFKLEAKILFFSLCSIFFLLLIRSFFHSDIGASIKSLSPILPVPIIGLLLLFPLDDRFRISPGTLSIFSQITLVVVFVIFIISNKGINKHFLQQVELFSGNPIPFSVCIFGISIFCLCDWQIASFRNKIIKAICVLLGFYLAGYLSGTRGTLVSIIICSPIIFCFLFYSNRIRILLLVILLVCLVSVWHGHSQKLFIDPYYGHVFEGIQSFLSNRTNDNSVAIKIELWTASVKAIKDSILFGYDVSNRFSAIVPNLPVGTKYSLTHPHNDIFASILSVGIIGGIFSITCLISPVIAAMLSTEQKITKLFLATCSTIVIFVTANLNTVLFNDITSAWLAFSTFVIWNLKESDLEPREK